MDPLFGPRGRGAGPAVLRAHLSAATQRIALVLDGVTASTTMVDALFSVEDELDTSMFRANNVSRDGERRRSRRVPPLGRAVTTRICDGRTPAWPPAFEYEPPPKGANQTAVYDALRRRTEALVKQGREYLKEGRARIRRQGGVKDLLDDGHRASGRRLSTTVGITGAPHVDFVATLRSPQPPSAVARTPSRTPLRAVTADTGPPPTAGGEGWENYLAQRFPECTSPASVSWPSLHIMAASRASTHLSRGGGRVR